VSEWRQLEAISQRRPLVVDSVLLEIIEEHHAGSNQQRTATKDDGSEK